MKCASIRDVPLGQSAGQVSDLIGQRIPFTILLVERCMRRGRDRMPFFDEGIQIDHFLVVVQKIEHDLS